MRLFFNFPAAFDRLVVRPGVGALATASRNGVLLRPSIVRLDRRPFAFRVFYQCDDND
jgi:hypothetical protein